MLKDIYKGKCYIDYRGGDIMKKTAVIITGVVIFLVIIIIAFIFGIKLILDNVNVSRKAITAEQFKTIMTQNGYNVMDITSKYATSTNGIEYVLIANDAANDYQVDFYVFSNASIAKSVFEENKNNFESEVSTNETYSFKEGKNYATYTANKLGKYMHVCCVDNTVIFCNIPNSNADKVKTIIESINY